MTQWASCFFNRQGGSLTLPKSGYLATCSLTPREPVRTKATCRIRIICEESSLASSVVILPDNRDVMRRHKHLRASILFSSRTGSGPRESAPAGRVCCPSQRDIPSLQSPHMAPRLMLSRYTNGDLYRARVISPARAAKEELLTRTSETQNESRMSNAKADRTGESRTVFPTLDVEHEEPG